jgi:hypothetical protein
MVSSPPQRHSAAKYSSKAPSSNCPLDIVGMVSALLHASSSGFATIAGESPSVASIPAMGGAGSRRHSNPFSDSHTAKPS